MTEATVATGPDLVSLSELHDAPHAVDAAAVLKRLGVDPETGLEAGAVARRRDRFGANRIASRTARSGWVILKDQLDSVVVLILIGAAVLSFAFGERIDALAISLVLLINTAIGFVSEQRAVNSMESLRGLDSLRARVLRDGHVSGIDAAELVPGDIVRLAAGDLVPADLRLVDQANLQSDESALTGESMPVAKQTARVAGDTALAERSPMVWRGCAITCGSGTGVVVATGAATQIGRIAALAAGASPERSPLERRLDLLGRELVWLTIGLAVVIAGAGVLGGQSLLDMARISVALAVAAVPEGLPVVATVALARGMWRMAERNALVNRLSAVETLGATTLILTDKTGTLTENRMSVRTLDLPQGLVDAAEFSAASEDPELHAALKVAALCNETAAAHGDPMELALIAAAAEAGLDRANLQETEPETGRVPFSRDLMMMATLHDGPDGARLYVKGAPDRVIDRCTEVRDGYGTAKLDEAGRRAWLDRNDALTADGLRVLALAHRPGDGTSPEDIRDLVLEGLIGLMDPARADVAEAVAACRAAGVRIVMVTGDQAGTAARIAEDVGIAPDGAACFQGGAGTSLAADAADGALSGVDVVARVTPEHKLDLVAFYQDRGEIVAMIGDGVNDAPALKKADIGIAMGQHGTDVAREASAMILRDDSFASIVAALRQGRVIFDNIRAFVIYLLSCNLSEILLIGGAVLAGLPLPLLPIHILFLNFVTDVFPAFALGFGEGNGREMARPPRDPSEPVVRRRHWLGIGLFGLLIAGAVLAAFLAAQALLELSQPQAVTVSFIALSYAQLWHVFNIRAVGTRLLSNEVTRNPVVLAAVAGCMVLVVLAVFVPGLSGFLRLENPGAAGWALALGAAAVPLVAGQAMLQLADVSILGRPAVSA